MALTTKLPMFTPEIVPAELCLGDTFSFGSFDIDSAYFNVPSVDTAGDLLRFVSSVNAADLLDSGTFVATYTDTADNNRYMLKSKHPSLEPDKSKTVPLSDVGERVSWGYEYRMNRIYRATEAGGLVHGKGFIDTRRRVFMGHVILLPEIGRPVLYNIPRRLGISIGDTLRVVEPRDGLDDWGDMPETVRDQNYAEAFAMTLRMIGRLTNGKLTDNRPYAIRGTD